LRRTGRTDDGHTRNQLIVVDHLFAEVLVGFDLAGREFRRAGSAVVLGDLDSIPIQVIARRDDPVQAHMRRIGQAGAEPKRLLRGQEIIVSSALARLIDDGVERSGARGQGEAGACHQSPGCQRDKT
jgi:hypothetical protein